MTKIDTVESLLTPEPQASGGPADPLRVYRKRSGSVGSECVEWILVHHYASTGWQTKVRPDPDWTKCRPPYEFPTILNNVKRLDGLVRRSVRIEGVNTSGEFGQR